MAPPPQTAQGAIALSRPSRLRLRTRPRSGYANTERIQGRRADGSHPPDPLMSGAILPTRPSSMTATESSESTGPLRLR
jgi:hypothetical protein